MNHKPGTYRKYSNIDARLAGHIVECATGERLDEYNKKIFLLP
ncbi:beta-lactamase family protein [Niabella sp. 3A5MI-3]|nr:beta-lactamase family protein [Niabella beijingensis]